MKRISVVIPCFNHGSFIRDAIGSLELGRYNDVFEVIIVNDGSTEQATIDVLNALSSEGYKVVNQKNGGLGRARNVGVSHATTGCILPLDCDNKINPSVFIEAVELMDKNPGIDAVYTDVRFFGDKEIDIQVGPLDLTRLVVDNYIDACALIRKSTFLKFQGYAEDMPYMGHEDWELWIKLTVNNCRIEYLSKQGFYYMVRNDSMLRSLNDNKLNSNREYIYTKYAPQLASTLAEIMAGYRRLREQERKLERIKKNKLRSAIKLFLGKSVW